MDLKRKTSLQGEATVPRLAVLVWIMQARWPQKLSGRAHCSSRLKPGDIIYQVEEERLQEWTSSRTLGNYDDCIHVHDQKWEYHIAMDRVVLLTYDLPPTHAKLLRPAPPPISI